MKNIKFKLLLTFLTLTLFSFTTKINAMENKIPEEKNIENKILENKNNYEEDKKENLKNQQEEENFKLRKINQSFLNCNDDCKKRIYSLKEDSFEKKDIEYIKEKHNKLKTNKKLEKENYEKILHSNIEKDEKQKN